MTASGTAERPILLFGAGGQVGTALAPRLAALGPVVTAVRADADLTRPDELRALVRRVAPRAIVNAAAYTAVDAAERDEARCRQVNVDAPAVLADEAARLSAPIVHYSTNYVFDGAAAEPYREDDSTAPLGVYGLTKALGERAVAAANPAHLVLRTAGVYCWAGQNFMLRILALAREREELQVVGDQLVAPTPASIVADATVGALRQVLAGGGHEGYGIFHLTTGGATSWHGFAERILALDPSRGEQRVKRVRAVRSDEFTSAARRPKNGVLDNDKFQRQFGVALPDWESALHRTIAEHHRA
jgi:dTDP-4-dehydrorhamnose reductase